MKEYIKNFVHSKVSLFILSIAILINFILLNFILAFDIKISNNFGNTLLFEFIVVGIVIILMLYVLNDNARIYVIANEIPISTWTVLIIVLSVISTLYIFLISSIPNIVSLVGNNVFSIIGGVSTLCGFWVTTVKKTQVLKVKITGDNINYFNGVVNIDGDSYFNVQALCDGEHEDVIKFVGFCLNTDFDYIREKRDGYKDRIQLPEYADGSNMIPSSEQIESNKLSHMYTLNSQYILGQLNIKNDDNQVKVEILYKDSEDNYFGQLMCINLNSKNESEKDVSVKKRSI